ncbi:MAG: hypothetical protein ABSH51_19085 [Solirubrobacteraceae bacterium]|jgi:hypothetical protein
MRTPQRRRRRPVPARALPAVVAALLALLALTPASALARPRPLAASRSQLAGLAPSQVTARDLCPPPTPGLDQCEAQLLVRRSDGARVHPDVVRGATFTSVGLRIARSSAFERAREVPAALAAAAGVTPPQSGTPAYLQQAYDLTYLSQTQGGSDTVAVVDAFDDPNAESDLATYRSTYGLPACTTANGCFRKVDQDGAPSPLPATNSVWGAEESLDLDAVSALCPNCHILLVETNSNGGSDLSAGLAEAAALGAQQISNSWGGVGSSAGSPVSFPGSAVIAGTGDTGYPGAGEDVYPAAFPGVTAVGATTLTPDTGAAGLRGFTESAWSLSDGAGGGSGCDLNEPKPAYQTDTGCTGRAYADVSADGNPQTGLSIYDSAQGGWLVGGGTSLATPLVAAFEAVAGVTGVTPQWAYTDGALLNDPASGSTGTCAAAILYICNAGPGYDGPTGMGSISGDIAPGAPGIGAPPIGAGSGDTYAQAVGATTATLSGGVYPNSLDTTYVWQYGTSAAYGHQTAAVDIGIGPGITAAPAALAGLLTDTTYHARLVAQNADGTTDGYDFTFTTTAAAAPVNTGVPTIAGTPRPGHTLTALAGAWNPSTVFLAYRWQRSGDRGARWSDVAGATGARFTLTAADIDADVRVVVTAADAGGSASAMSAPVGQVATTARIASRPAPTISARRLSGGRIALTTHAKPAATILLVRTGRRIERTGRRTLVVRAEGTVWWALQAPDQPRLRWLRVTVS